MIEPRTRQITMTADAAMGVFVIAGHWGSAFGRPKCKLDPAIHATCKSAWTTESSPVVTTDGRAVSG